jgi:hypothetical protein
MNKKLCYIISNSNEISVTSITQSNILATFTKENKLYKKLVFFESNSRKVSFTPQMRPVRELLSTHTFMLKFLIDSFRCDVSK